MALMALMLRKKINDKKKLLESLRAKDKEFAAREAELEASIEEARTEEEQNTVEEAIEEFESEKEEHETAKKSLEDEISEAEQGLEEAERAQEPALETRTEERATPVPEVRATEVITVNRSVTNFYGLTMMERDAMLAREDVQAFLAQVRTCIKEKRALTNAGLTIPDVMLPLLKQVVEETSKLIGKVRLQYVTGTSRQTIMGTIPEAVWTEMCATLNELSLGFNQTEVDGYKVGGFFAICNAILEDNDVNLASEIIDALGKSIGKALDKAIVYGKGVKMPIGVVTRLNQTSRPSGYSDNDRTWVDLHETNVLTGTGATGINLFKEIMTNAACIYNDYFEGGITWIMNQKTHAKLMVESMGVNANATIVGGMNNSMPVIGGEIVELPFIPDDNIVFGYFDGYLLAERAGTNIGQSEHYRFVEDQTVFRGTARYDGKPVIAEAFGVLTISNSAPTPAANIVFPSDSANP